ncbi:MAG: hypothetical protein PSX71_05185 [bacterium]|nr:hypothetical protein [bacterium]
MATTPSFLHEPSRPRDAVVALSLAGLAMLHVWELPRLAAGHGGFAFVAAWAACLLLLALPLLMLELMLGRRARRSPIAGMSVLTREADTSRLWRASVWGSALAGLLALAAIALIAGGSINFLAHEAGLVDAGAEAARHAGLALPLGTAALFVLAAGLSLLAPARRAWLLAGVLVLVLLLLLLAAVAGFGAATSVYPVSGLAPADWREALRLALLSLGSGLGVVWIAGLRTVKENSLARLAGSVLALHVVLGVLLLLALAPFAAAALANPAGETLQIVPTGASVWVVMTALILTAVAALLLLAEPLLLWMQEQDMARLPAVALVFVLAAVSAELLWFVGQAGAVQGLLKGLGVLLLMVLLGFALFAGWIMKISHARKELALPNEGLYNLWRVAVRIALPLAIVWVLSGYIL